MKPSIGELGEELIFIFIFPFLLSGLKNTEGKELKKVCVGIGSPYSSNAFMSF